MTGASTPFTSSGFGGDAVVFEQVIQVTNSRALAEAQRIAVMLTWIDCIQAKAARTMAGSDRRVAAIMLERARKSSP